MVREGKGYGICIFPFYGALKLNQILYTMAVLKPTYNFIFNPLKIYWGPFYRVPGLSTGDKAME